MPRVQVLLEVDAAEPEAFAAFDAASESEVDALDQAEQLLEPLAGLSLDVAERAKPVPMFTSPGAEAPEEASALQAFATPETNPDATSVTKVISAEVERGTLGELRERPGVSVWPSSEFVIFDERDALGDELESDDMDPEAVVDLARSRPGVDCRPFRPAAEIRRVRQLLGTGAVWAHGFRGQNVAVGILDEGVDGSVYPITGGFSRPGAQRPGTAPITSHGSMCAADVLIAAPQARLYDYPFLGVPRSGGALAMFQAVLEQRRRDGTPHLTTNSYGFAGVPPRDQAPNHEIWDLNHPLHRKIREVIASGAAAFFAAGNCGSECPSGNCHPSGVGPERSIHASNSLQEVITVAAVNARHERIGYSSQGPGMFQRDKPDLASYSHVFGNFGPGRPGGTEDQAFDNGTSAATPVAAGVGALLLSAYPSLLPDRIRTALIDGAVKVTGGDWDPGYGRGIVNAAASYRLLRRTEDRA